MSRPNFLVILTDQMRADHMGCAGNPVIQTPHLDALAADGVHVPRAYVNCPLCMPSRSTLFTGLTPRGHQVRTNGIQLDPRLPTLPATLHEAGYATANVGKVHLTNFGLRPGLPDDVTDPQVNPECIDYWKRGLIDRVPTPYYGLQDVEVALAHGMGTHGNYRLWLEREHPEVAQRIVDGAVERAPLGTSATFPGPEETHHTAWVAERTLHHLDRLAEQDQPFFLMCSFPDPHHPYEPPAPYDHMYRPEDVIGPKWRDREIETLAPFFTQVQQEPLRLSGTPGRTAKSEDEYREILAYQYGQITNVDTHVGRVLHRLDELNLRDNTVVVFMSDHGDLMGDHRLLNKGPFHFEGLLRVPMILRWPGHFPAGQAASGLASLLDFVPTVMDLAGLEYESLTGPHPDEPECPNQFPALPGRSLSPMLGGQTDRVQSSVVIENDEDYLGLRLRTLVTSRYKLTTYTGQRGPEAFGELFDLHEDPDELYNLWHAPEHDTLRRDLTLELHHRLTETDIGTPRRLSHA